MSDAWERRLRRAEQLQRQWPFAVATLRFFEHIYPFQSRVHASVMTLAQPHPALDLPRFVPELIGIVEAHGPASLLQHASRLKDLPDEAWDRFIQTHQKLFSGPTPPPQAFYVRVLFEPCATAYDARGTDLAQSESRASGGSPQDCPRCGNPPQVSVLREDKVAETVRRSLVCSLCSLEWEFPRVACPACREERPEKLPRFTAEEIPWIRVEACDTCMKYLKSVDLTKEPDAEPVVDELASTPLDVVAREKGYAKLTPNLAGL